MTRFGRARSCSTPSRNSVRPFEFPFRTGMCEPPCPPRRRHRVWDVMQAADLLLDVNASKKEAAMFNVDTRASHFMAERWHLTLHFRNEDCAR